MSIKVHLLPGQPNERGGTSGGIAGRESSRTRDCRRPDHTAKRIDDLKALRQWLNVLVAPGASLGGARPKASFTETNGSLWIAKFPARDDSRDVGAWGSTRAADGRSGRY
jgi:hypothetical protein